ncbi:MAG: hypothetical protein KJ666_11555 [Bacteroidetes bacterium]|nr:hypothetical protein [Bacteroidota bacterium]
MKTNSIKTSVIALLFLVVSLSPGCSTEPESDKPEIVGCNSVKYKGVTFSRIGCAPGIASFYVTATQGGVTGNFHITCSGGCILSVTVIK